MFRHVVMFRWTDEATDEQKRRVATELTRLPAAVDSLRAYTFGSDAEVNTGNYDFAVVADFDDVAGYVKYRDDPTHRAIITEHIAPIIAERAAVQFTIDG